MAANTKHSECELSMHGLRIERKFNLCGFFEWHVLNDANQTIAKNTVQQFAIDIALNTLQA